MKTNKLIDDFFNGSSSDNDEQKLRQLLHDSVDSDSYFKVMDGIKDSNPFDNENSIEIDINRITRRAKKQNFLIIKDAFVGIAASLLIVFSLHFLIPSSDKTVGNYYVSNSGKTEQEVIELTNKMLKLFSKNLSIPAEKLQLISSLQKGIKPIDKINVLGEFSEKLEKMSYVDFSLDINKNN